MNPTRVAVIGAGHWGPNLVRCFVDNVESEVAMVCDLSEQRRRQLAARYPQLRIVDDPQTAITADDVDAVVIATPTATHHQLARDALKAGKHVLCEKPVTTTVAKAEELRQLAAENRRVLMTGHVFLYNLGIRALKQTINEAAFGQLKYMHARRTNLGPVRRDVHAGWDLASHDISIFIYLKDHTPTEVTASGQSFINPDLYDVVFATLYFDDGSVAHLHASWLDPQKVRQLTVVGDSQMVVFDDMRLMEPLRIFNKGYRRAEDAATKPIVDTLGAFRVQLVQGDVVIPPLSVGEPLRNECNAFVDAVRTGETPLSDGGLGVEVVRVLRAIDRSLADGSRRMRVAAD